MKDVPCHFQRAFSYQKFSQTCECAYKENLGQLIIFYSFSDNFKWKRTNKFPWIFLILEEKSAMVTMLKLYFSICIVYI